VQPTRRAASRPPASASSTSVKATHRANSAEAEGTPSAEPVVAATAEAGDEAAPSQTTETAVADGGKPEATKGDAETAAA
jgi:hypothetical protein